MSAPTQDLVESVCDNIASILKSQLPVKIAAMNSKDTEYQVDVPPDSDYYFRPFSPIHQLQGAQVFIYPISTRFEEQSYDHITAHHTINIDFALNCNTPEEVQRSLERLLTSTFLIFRKNQGLNAGSGETVIGVSLVGIDWGTSWSEEDGETGLGGLTVSVQKQEE